MIRISGVVVALLLARVASGASRADDETDARAIVDKAVQAAGGEDVLKYKASTSKLKGTVHAQGMELAFTGDVTTQGADQHRVDVEIDVNGQKVSFISVLNKDKGWMKVGDETSPMDEDKLTETKESAFAGWVASLAPLKGKDFKLATVGESKVGDAAVLGVRVSHPGRRDVNLYFDKKTYLLLKSETRVKDEETGQEVTEETFLSAHADKGLRQSMKFTIKRDGKPYVDADILEFKPEEKIDDGVFGKP